MAERDRLKKLLDEVFIKSDDNYGIPNIEQVADYLIANGVVVLPCKVGDKVYQTDGVRLYESQIKSIIYDTNNIAFDENAIGKSIFLTREEAEKALEGMRKEDESNDN